MDCRHPLAPPDRLLLDWLKPTGRAVHVLLTKCDKLSAQAAKRTLAIARRDLDAVYPGATMQLFSSMRRTGVVEAKACIERWVLSSKTKGPGERG